MATSGTSTWNLPIDEIIEEALDHVGGEHISGDEAKSARRSLNLLFRDMENRGYPLAQLREISVTMVEDQREYILDADVMAIMDFVIEKDDTEVGLNRMSLFDFNKIANKDSTGKPTNFTSNRQRDAITMKVWPLPDNSTDVIKGWVVKRIEDVTKSNQDADLNVRFLPAIVAGLAYFMAFKRTGIDANYRLELKAHYEELIDRALLEDKERTNLKAVPRLNLQ